MYSITRQSTCLNWTYSQILMEIWKSVTVATNELVANLTTNLKAKARAGCTQEGLDMHDPWIKPNHRLHTYHKAKSKRASTKSQRNSTAFQVKEWQLKVRGRPSLMRLAKTQKRLEWRRSVTMRMQLIALREQMPTKISSFSNNISTPTRAMHSQFLFQQAMRVTLRRPCLPR